MINNLKKYIPNTITSLRFLLAFLFPIAFMLDRTLIALSIFIIAALTDALDGFLARRWNVISDFGKRIDPIADKWLSGFALILTSIYINYCLFIILLLEIFISINNVVLYATNKNINVSKWGKIKTTILFTTISITLLSALNSFFIYPLYLLIILTIILQIISIKGYILIYKK